MAEPRAFKGVFIPRSIWLSSEISTTEKAILAEIDSLDGDEGCYAKNSHFAKFIGISTRQVQRYISDLVEKGYITCEVIRAENKQVIKRTLHIVKEKWADINDVRGSDKNDVRGYDESVAESKPLKRNTFNNNYSVGDECGSDDDDISPTSICMPDYSRILELWNAIEELPHCQSITEQRKKHINARVREYSYETMIEVLEMIAKSPFLKGNNDRGWKPNFDWWIKPTNFVKILEGTYNRGWSFDSQNTEEAKVSGYEYQ